MAAITLAQYGTGALVTATLHPLGYAKVLIQTGYEPLPPKSSVSLFGKESLVYPNVLQYISHIKKVDGFWGMYRGVFPRVLSGTLGNIVQHNVAAKLKAAAADKKPEKEDEEVKEPAKNSQDNEASEKPDHRQHHHHQHQRHHENDAKERPATMKPFVNRGPRGPMMMPPRPVSIFRPPAYSQHGVLNARKNPCGRFRVGAKYWDDCNLCLCTSKGPKCQGKLCR